MASKSRSATKSKKQAVNYDTPWKIALEHHFQHFMAFFFPRAYAQIDWRVPHQFLDKELKAISKYALVGTRHVDKLVKVQRLSGQDDWLCIHIEVQVARTAQFAERMFVYNYRIFDRYARPVASMAVLGDDDPQWQPVEFGYQVMDCEMAFRFPIAKLAQFADQEAALLVNPNPFALVTLAYLYSRSARDDMLAMYEVKCRLVRLLLSRKWERQLIREFFLVIDWMLALPPELELQLSHFITALEEEQKMDYVSSIERIKLEQVREACLQEGRQEGRQEGLLFGKQEGESSMLSRLLARRFGDLPQSVQTRVKNASKAQIELWFDRAIAALSLDEVFQDTAHP